MVKRAKTEDAGTIAALAIQMWTENDPEDLEEEFRALEFKNIYKYLINRIYFLMHQCYI